MKIKSIMLISLILLIISLTAVSAESFDDGPDSPTIDDSIMISSDIQNPQVDSVEPGTFYDLQREVNNAPAGSVLNLTRDYNGDYHLIVSLNKDLTINGQGHTIDCLGKTCSIAFESKSGNIILKNLIIKNGNYDKSDKGGAIHIYDSAKYTLENCTFENNHAYVYGGAIYNEAENALTIKNCVFKSNRAETDEGGAICSKGIVNIENSLFISNEARHLGGAVYSDKDVNAFNTTFQSNKAKGEFFYQCRGGAIYADQFVNIYNCTFKDNYAEDYGGAVQCGEFTMKNDKYPSSLMSYFINNVADDNDGGAIYVEKYKVIVSNAVFSGNEAKDEGGAIYCGSEVTIDNCTFKSNKAKNSGGAVYAESAALKNTYSYFENNVARTGKGGAIYTDKFTQTVSHVSFIGNTAGTEAITSDCGGAVYTLNDVSFSNCVFINNYCTDNGGAVYVNNILSDTYLRNNIFINNYAGNEGDSVFTVGYFETIKDNWWSNNPSSSNNQLIEHHTFFSNTHYSDVNPLIMDLVLSTYVTASGDSITAKLNFYNADGSPYTGEMSDNYLTSFTVSPDAEILAKDMNRIRFMPGEYGTYTVSSNLGGKVISKTLNVINITVSAPEITTYYDVAKTFRIHLDGDKRCISNQKVTVTLGTWKYVVYTDENGDASLEFRDYTVQGTRPIKINVFDLNVESSITVISTIIAQDIVRVYGDHTPFSATFTNQNGDYLPEFTMVIFNIDNTVSLFGQVKNNESLVEFNIGYLGVGEHYIELFNPITMESRYFTITILPSGNGESINDVPLSQNSYNQTIPDENNKTEDGEELTVDV